MGYPNYKASLKDLKIQLTQELLWFAPFQILLTAVLAEMLEVLVCHVRRVCDVAHRVVGEQGPDVVAQSKAEMVKTML